MNASQQTNNMIMEFEDVKKIVQSITRKAQRAGSLEWYVVHEEYDYQVLYCYAIDNNNIPMVAHVHAESNEYFIILSGELEVNGKILHNGDTTTITPKQPHIVRPLSLNTKFLAILHPPEAAYVEQP